MAQKHAMLTGEVLAAGPIHLRQPLSKQERLAMRKAYSSRKMRQPQWVKYQESALARLMYPVDDILNFEGTYGIYTRNRVKVNLICGMQEYGTSYWGWSPSQWLRLLNPDSPEAVGYNDKGVGMHSMIAFAYVVGDFMDIHLCAHVSLNRVCRVVFGHKAVDISIERCCRELSRIGYGGSLAIKRIPNVLC